MCQIRLVFNFGWGTLWPLEACPLPPKRKSCDRLWIERHAKSKCTAGISASKVVSVVGVSWVAVEEGCQKTYQGVEQDRTDNGTLSDSVDEWENVAFIFLYLLLFFELAVD